MQFPFGAFSLRHVAGADPGARSEFILRAWLTAAAVGGVLGFLLHAFSRSANHPALLRKTALAGAVGGALGIAWWFVQPPTPPGGASDLQILIGADRAIRLAVLSASIAALSSSSSRWPVQKALGVSVGLGLALRSLVYAFLDISDLRRPWALIDAMVPGAAQDAALPLLIGFGLMAYRRSRGQAGLASRTQ
jgi:hypothetical protein